MGIGRERFGNVQTEVWRKEGIRKAMTREKGGRKKRYSRKREGKKIPLISFPFFVWL